WWRGLGGTASRRAAGWLALAWALGNTSVFALLFGTGWLLLGGPVRGAAMVLGGGVGVWLTLRATGRARVALGLDPAGTRAPACG
ncbi:MAG TPA: hypothetical protein VMK65_10320, partial [Longimicrobiales bacterium]|nr:hypothetical protein [Longimicrobiales bacterium]